MEVVRPHVGLGVHQDVPGRAAGGQLLQDEAVADVLRAGIELAVGEGPGAALPELDVGPRVQASRAEEGFHIALPLLHRAAPLQQDGAQPRLGQHQGGEEPRGPGAHHHGRHRRRRQGRRRRVRRGLCGPADLPAPGSAENSGLLLDRDLHRVDQADFFPGVHTAAE